MNSPILKKLLFEQGILFNDAVELRLKSCVLIFVYIKLVVALSELCL